MAPAHLGECIGPEDIDRSKAEREREKKKRKEEG